MNEFEPRGTNRVSGHNTETRACELIDAPPMYTRHSGLASCTTFAESYLFLALGLRPCVARHPGCVPCPGRRDFNRAVFARVNSSSASFRNARPESLPLAIAPAEDLQRLKPTSAPLSSSFILEPPNDDLWVLAMSAWIVPRRRSSAIENCDGPHPRKREASTAQPRDRSFSGPSF